MHHYRKTIKQYMATKAKNEALKQCPFCVSETIEKCLYETDLSYVVRNITEYDLWESHEVVDHLMIIPKRHVENFVSMSDNERLDVMRIAAHYEADGYNVYARGVGSATRSVKHQHTHLIKINDKDPRLVLHVKKPYFLFRW